MAPLPKLALIPSGYKAGKIYSVLPTSGVGDFDFTRDTIATRINSSGLIETVASGVPRLNYPLIDGVVNGCPSHLLEPLRTNLITYSEAFDNAYWTKLGTSFNVTPNNVISPSGELNASTINVTNNDNILYRSISLSSSQSNWNFSIYAKGTGTFNMNIRLNSATTTTETKTLTNEWQRFDVSVIGTPTINSVESYIELNTSSTYQIWGAQVEDGSYPTSYIPNYGTAAGVTRSAETANGAGDASTFNDSEGVLYVETKGFIDVTSDNSVYIQLSKSGEASFNNSLVLQHRNNGYLRIYANGSATADIHFNVNIDFTENHKIAVLYKLNGYKLFIDGVSQSLFGTPTQTVFSGLNDFSFDNRGALSWNGSIKDARVYNTALTDAELISLTSL